MQGILTILESRVRLMSLAGGGCTVKSGVGAAVLTGVGDRGYQNNKNTYYKRWSGVSFVLFTQ